MNNMDELLIKVDDASDIGFQVINKIKEQAPRVLDLNDIVNTIVNESIGTTWIIKSIYQSHQFRNYMNNFLTSDQYQLFLVLSFDEFDELIKSDYTLTSIKTHELLNQYIEQSIRLSRTLNDKIGWLTGSNHVSHKLETVLENKLKTNLDLIIIKIALITFIQEICFWK